MVSRSFVAVLLSAPATIAVIGLFLAITPPIGALRLPALLMVFPVWVGIACASYLIHSARLAAAVLVGISLVGFGLIELLKQTTVVGA
ncbi:MAG: hypothetical protein AAGA23_15905 [Pseudomonadota bacterium]